MIKPKIWKLFGVGVVGYYIGDQINNEEIAKAVQENLELDDDSLGGKQTTKEFYQDNALDELVGYWLKYIKEEGIKGRTVDVYQMDGWGVVFGPNDLSAKIVHDHLPWHLSCVYYVQAPEDLPGDEGSLCFHNPNPYESKQKMYLKPRPGTIVTFPSYLRHHVNPYTADGERISVSMNALVSL